MRRLVGLFLSLLLLCAMPLTAAPGSRDGVVGALYTMTNSAAGNEVLAYPRGANGTLGAPTASSTRGLGTGAGLGNQGGVTLTDNEQWLLVVNAGSNTVSVFDVRPHGLRLTDVADSHGAQPVSITVDRDLVYVLNAGGAVGSTDSIAGFQLGRHGRLRYLQGSNRPLSGASTGPAQIGFDPRGRVLVVTEKATNMVDTFVVSRDGLPVAPVPNTFASPGATPFGFDFGKRSQLFVSEAAGGAPGGSSATSYRVRRNGDLQVISGAVPTTQTAACWLLVSKGGRRAFTTNTGDASVSSFHIDADGTLTLANAQAGATGAGPIDMAFSNNGRYLYTLNSGGASISIFGVNGDGGLSQAHPNVTVVAGANGMAVR